MRFSRVSRASALLLLALLVGCSALFRDLKRELIVVNAALSGDEVEITLRNSFISAYQNRTTIRLRLEVEKADDEPHGAVLDGDFHLAGESTKIGLPVVAEIANAASEPGAIDRIHLAASTHRPIRVAGAWRLWSEHVGDATEVQGAAIATLDDASPGHVFELHPLTFVEERDLRRTFRPVEGYLPQRAESVFKTLEKTPFRIVPKGKSTTLVTRTRQFNDVEFILEVATGRQLVVEDGRFVVAAALDLHGNRLVDRLRMVFVKGTPPERNVRHLKSGDRMHVFGLPRINLAAVNQRLRQAGRNPALLDRPLPYEIVIVGEYPSERRQ